jgi:hypothetical protein
VHDFVRLAVEKYDLRIGIFHVEIDIVLKVRRPVHNNQDVAIKIDVCDRIGLLHLDHCYREKDDKTEQRIEQQICERQIRVKVSLHCS